ncbi:regulatory protein RecX [Pelotalea chapellei]|uniref:regulatory protein RecX n=1 Tax=Pelotalea chapellei TaxID=44671 RepID=UPI001FE920CE|nr:regulatory protein RecX [Pelotalea chapellei]
MRNTDQSTAERAWQYALRLLAARDYTSARLSDKLLAREFSKEDVAAAISRLESEQWISDRRFAERFAESSLAAGRFFGPRLRLELRRRGVPQEMIGEVLSRYEHDEENEVQALLDRRFPGFSSSTASDKEKRRVLGFLQRRGLKTSVIFKVLREMEPS